MSRNASGTYSLPTGNPVVTGLRLVRRSTTTRTPDIATEITIPVSKSHDYTITGDWIHQGDNTWSGSNYILRHDVYQGPTGNPCSGNLKLWYGYNRL